jgi:hypothetical protein
VRSGNDISPDEIGLDADDGAGVTWPLVIILSVEAICVSPNRSSRRDSAEAAAGLLDGAGVEIMIGWDDDREFDGLRVEIAIEDTGGCVGCGGSVVDGIRADGAIEEGVLAAAVDEMVAFRLLDEGTLRRLGVGTRDASF